MRLKTLIVSTAIASAGALLAPSTADACGGFFCSQSAPVVQTAERILFMQLDDNTIETHVQISYTGPSEDFAWIVPTPSQPVLSLGSDTIFQSLDAVGPPIRIERGETVGTCRAEEPSADATSSDIRVGADSEAGTGGGVTIVALETVGPFDTAVIQASAVEPMMEWLDANGYDLPPQTAALLAPYVEGDMYFLALKLTKDASAGDLQPIAMTYNAPAPMIPIQLTAIAAADDMPIQTWVVGDEYAAPANYAEVEPDPISVVTSGWTRSAQAAVDSLDERSMTRSYADEATPIAARFYRDSYENDIAGLRELETADALYDRLAFQSFGSALQSSPLAISVYQFCAPMPERLLEDGIAAATFYGCPQCFVESEEEWTTPGGDACADFVDERFVEPLRRVSGYFRELRTASRFDTWLDADEMDLDPMFCWDADLEARQTISATRTRYCRDDLYAWEAPDRIDVDGLSFFPNENGTYSGRAPVASITRHGCAQGDTDVEVPTGAQTRALVAQRSRASFEGWFGNLDEDNMPAPARQESSACAASGAAGAWWMLMLVPVALRRRR
ncbi:MAG: hypothetical protein ACJA1R_000644 [Flavobacteriales bacterium]|jgi:hypothetical protein